MADHSIDPRSWQMLTCSNESHVAFGHSFLFPAFIEERQGRDVSTPSLIKHCLLKSGLSYHSSESLQLHSCLFHQCFLSSPSGLNNGSSDVAGFTSHDYFEAVVDKELGWFQYYKKILPFVRLELAVKILSSLDEFCSCRQSDVMPCSGLATQMTLLLVSTLEMFFSIVCDFYAGSKAFPENQTPQDSNSNDEVNIPSYPSSLYSLCEQLSHKTAKFLSILLSELCKNESECKNACAMEEDEDTKKYFIELLLLSLFCVNPFCTSSEIRNSLQESLVGRVGQSQFHGVDKDSVLRGQGLESITNRRSYSNGFISKQVFIKRLSTRKECNQFKGNECDSKERIVSIGTDLSTEKDKSVNIERGNQISDITKTDSEFNHSYSTVHDPSLFLLKHLRKMVSAKLFVKMVSYFTRGEDVIHTDFYNSLSTIVEDKSHVKVCDHFIGRQKMFLRVENLLLQLTSGSKEKLSSTITDPEALTSDSFIDELSSSLSTVKAYPDRKQFSLSPAEKVLLTGRQLAGENDLTLIKLAVEECMPGWIKLVTLGMQNKDYVNWWHQGFLSVILKKVDYLCTESNAMQVLFVLYDLSREELINWDHVKKMTDLLTVMLRRLPSLLQERLVLSQPHPDKKTVHVPIPTMDHGVSSGDVSSAPQTQMTNSEEGEGRSGLQEKDLLCRLKSKEEVLKSVTTLLNRMTCDNVEQLLPDVLMLCLYNKEAVITQALQAAIDNKGQLSPVVMLLRGMPKVCNTPVVQCGHSLLMRCLGHVLRVTQLDERAEENTVQLLNTLTQGYDRSLDASTGVTHWVSDGVVSVQEIMEVLIIPALDRQMSSSSINGNEEITTTTTSTSQIEDFSIQLPTSVVLQCFNLITQTASSDKLHCLQGVVMVQALTAVCIRHWSWFSTKGGNYGHPSSDCSSGSNRDGDGGKTRRRSNSDAVWLCARNCLDCLMERLKTEGSLDSPSLDWLLEASYRQGGLQALALMYPLFSQHEYFQLAPVLQIFIKDMTIKLGEYAVLTTLLGLGQINSAICQTVTDFIVTDAVMSAVSLDRKLFPSVVAQVVSGSSSCDMARTCSLLKGLVSRFFVGVEDAHQEYLVDFIDWSTMGREPQINHVCVQYLTDSLMWLASSDPDPSGMTVCVVNYQAACQALLEGQTNTAHPSTGRQELMVYTFVQCCSILCLPQVPTMPQAFQGIHVLAMTLLTGMTAAFEKGESKMRDSDSKTGQKSEEGMEKDLVVDKLHVKNEKTEGGLNRMSRSEKNDVTTSSEKVVVDKEERLSVKEWATKELLLSLRDVIVCIRDDSIGKQLEKQLSKMYDAFCW